MPAQAIAPAAVRRPLDVAEHLARRAQQRAGAADGLAGRAGTLEERVGEQLRRGGLGARDPGRLAASSGGSGSGEVVNSTEVMSTPETPSTSAWWVLQIIANRALPSGPGARPSTRWTSHSGLWRSSGIAKSRPARRRELLVGAGTRQRRVAHVVAEVEVRVVDPDRPALVERDERELLAVARDQVHALIERREHLVVGRAARPRT